MSSDSPAERLHNTLVVLFSPPRETPTEEQVREQAALLAQGLGYEGNLDAIVAAVLAEVVTRMDEGFALDDTTAEHDAEWAEKFEADPEVDRVYFPAYERFLREQGWNAQVVESLNNVSTKILGRLQDPRSEGAWDRRGLVIGHVQSGKTSNYTGLIAKAADAGYKFIIVIAGIHNVLRTQTQERIDQGFIGRSSNPENTVRVGVGRTEGYPHPVTLTTVHDDFNRQTARTSLARLNDFAQPVVLVIKKNVSTLKTLHDWLKLMNARGSDVIADVPMLMIDDEADNASINTNKEDQDPTRTNAELRRILRLFHKSSYVGYTATPFANIFINPEAYDDEVREELFPRDFIYCLDAPTSYFGAEKVFLEDSDAEGDEDSFTRPIHDCEDLLPLRHKKEHGLTELPPSLHRAIHTFVIARTIRNLRDQTDQHCSMMVNVSRFVAVQEIVRNLIRIYVRQLQEAVSANYAMPDAVALENRYMRALKEAYEEEYPGVDLEWAQVKDGLGEACNCLRLFVINSKTTDRLDYAKAERDGHSLTAIAVGGLSLSRGLTIEGLCVSYMYRNTRMYDTLMQMGRWFGYRPGYEELCRIHLSPDSIAWYAYITEASEELRQQIKDMGRMGKTPRDFGLYVTADPGALMITAANKMRTGTLVERQISYSGKRYEPRRLPDDGEIHRSNELLIEKAWKDGFGRGEGAVQKTKKGWWVQDAPISAVEDFLLRFKVHSAAEEEFRHVIDYLRKISERYPQGDVLLISPKGEASGRYRLVPQVRVKTLDPVGEGGGWRLHKGTVISRKDEGLGLDEEQLEKAHAAAGNGEVTAYHYRAQRGKPLLMLHLLAVQRKGESGKQPLVPTFGLSFPPPPPSGDVAERVRVFANRVYVQTTFGFEEAVDDTEEDEE